MVSGGWDPIHIGHINLIQEAKKLGDYLIVIVNNDVQVKVKGNIEFMPEQERLKIIGALRYVDEVFLSIDIGLPISESLKAVAQKYQKSDLYFAKGGDRNISNLPESEKKVCEDFNIKIVNGVGGDKVQSSSWLLSRAVKSK